MATTCSLQLLAHHLATPPTPPPSPTTLPTIHEEEQEDDAVSVVEWAPPKDIATEDEDEEEVTPWQPAPLPSVKLFTATPEPPRPVHGLFIDIAAANAVWNTELPQAERVPDLEADLVHKRKFDAMERKYCDLESDLVRERKRKFDTMEMYEGLKDRHDDLVRNLRTVTARMVAPVLVERFLDACLINELTSGAFEI
jgi:hypothetical protein